MSERGIFGVVEGSDGTGKSVQVRALADWSDANGRQALRVLNDETGRMEPIQEPGGTPYANELRRKIKDRSIARTPWQNVIWFTAARKSIYEELIVPSLEADMDVWLARSDVSTKVYQGYAEGVPLEDIDAYTREQVGEAYMRPDFVAILALKSELKRQERLANADRSRGSESDYFESKPAAFQAALQSGYVRYALEHGIQLFDADRTPEAIHADLLDTKVKPLLEERRKS